MRDVMLRVEGMGKGRRGCGCLTLMSVGGCHVEGVVAAVGVCRGEEDVEMRGG